MRWIGTEGGPLILIAEAALAAWRGSVSANGRSDYDRACEVDDYVGVIATGTGDALVLGDEPLDTSWITDERGGGQLVRWVYADCKDAVRRHVKDLEDELFTSSGIRFLAQQPTHYLLDAAVEGSGIAAADHLTIDLVCGEYLVETCKYQPDSRTSLLVHRLKLVRSTERFPRGES